jgi:hypothetical protein
MASKTPTWVWVVFGILGFCALLFIAFVGGTIFMFRSHVHTDAMPRQTAQQEFDRQRNRFAGQEPLVQVAKEQENDSKVVVHRPPQSATRQDLQAIRVLTYDERNGRLVTIDVPVWLARWAFSNRGGRGGRRTVSIGNGSIELESGDLTFDDIERHGPGLILDATDERGAQVLVWAE